MFDSDKPLLSMIIDDGTTPKGSMKKNTSGAATKEKYEPSDELMQSQWQVSPDTSILISKINCVYLSGQYPVVGTLYLYSEAVCFYSLMNCNTLFKKSTEEKIVDGQDVSKRTFIKLHYSQMGHVMMEEDLEGVNPNKCLTIMLNGLVKNKFHKFSKSKDFQELFQIKEYIGQMISSFAEIERNKQREIMRSQIMQKQRSLQEDPQQIINNVIQMKKSQSEMEINEETNLYMDPVLDFNDNNSE